VQNVCFWHKADMAIALRDVRFWGVKRTLIGYAPMSAFDPERTSAVVAAKAGFLIRVKFRFHTEYYTRSKVSVADGAVR